MRILIQFIGQAIGVVLLRRKNGTANLIYKMPFYPLPVLLAIIIWLLVFISTGKEFMLSGLTVIAVGIVVYFIKLNFEKKNNGLIKKQT